MVWVYLAGVVVFLTCFVWHDTRIEPVNLGALSWLLVAAVLWPMVIVFLAIAVFCEAVNKIPWNRVVFKKRSSMPLGNEHIYKGESELEYYKLLDPDDDIPEDPLECDGCGDFVDELFETADMVSLCWLCYHELLEEAEEVEGFDDE